MDPITGTGNPYGKECPCGKRSPGGTSKVCPRGKNSPGGTGGVPAREELPWENGGCARAGSTPLGEQARRTCTGKVPLGGQARCTVWRGLMGCNFASFDLNYLCTGSNGRSLSTRTFGRQTTNMIRLQPQRTALSSQRTGILNPVLYEPGEIPRSQPSLRL